MTRVERVTDLESSLHVRQHELSSLRSRRDELYALLGLDAVDDPESPLNHPALAYIGKKAPALTAIPPEQFGNIITQVDLAILAFQEKTKALVKASEEIKLHTKNQEEQAANLAAQAELMTNITGLPQGSGLTGKQSSTSPIAVFASNNTFSDVDGDPTAAQAFREQLKRQAVGVERERHAGQVLHNKKAKAIVELESTLKKKREQRESLHVMFNDLRCLDRDVREKKIELARVADEHEALDRQLRDTIDRNMPATRAILDRDVADINRKIEDCVEGQRRVQDRVVKAQEYRILQLEKRLQLLRSAVKSHRLEGAVDQQLAAGAVRSASGISMESVPDREQMYDIDKVIPPREKVHAAIFSLLASERDRLSRMVSTMQIMLKEKDESIEAMTVKISDMTSQYDAAVESLEKASAEVYYASEGHKAEAMTIAQEQREKYHALLKEKLELTKQQQRQRSERRSASGTHHADPFSTAS